MGNSFVEEDAEFWEELGLNSMRLGKIITYINNVLNSIIQNIIRNHVVINLFQIILNKLN
jgi:hypothetical protein